jgi:hypothetical protein
MGKPLKKNKGKPMRYMGKLTLKKKPSSVSLFREVIRQSFLFIDFSFHLISIKASQSEAFLMVAPKPI